MKVAVNKPAQFVALLAIAFRRFRRVVRALPHITALRVRAFPLYP